MSRRSTARAAAAIAAALALAATLGACGPEGDGDGTAHRPTPHHAAAGVVAGAAAPTRHIGPQGNVGQFVTDCGYSHSAPDDPIVHPNRPGASHVHDFFGNTTTDAGSTLASLTGEGTTCKKKVDTAAYWSPRLLRDGRPVIPTKSTAYYRAAPGVDPTDVEAYPAGLMVVAGDMTANADAPQDTDLAGWTCGTGSNLAPTPPACPASAPLRALITFPDCWDGEHVDSDDHRSHMANSAGGECPDSHPVHVAQLTFAISYPVTGAVEDLSLASGSTHGIHADFVNAWDQDGLVNEIESCLHRGAVCGLSSNRAEEALFSG